MQMHAPNAGRNRCGPSWKAFVKRLSVNPMQGWRLKFFGVKIDIPLEVGEFAWKTNGFGARDLHFKTLKCWQPGSHSCAEPSKKLGSSRRS